MLQPLFDRDCELIGWLKPNEHIFDSDMNWVAYISNGHVWAETTGNWIGPINDLVCLDTNGKVIAWSRGASIRGSARPARPARAARKARPARPARPATPVGGWSQLSISEWLEQ